MGTIDREGLVREQMRPERHVWWDKGTGQIKGSISMGNGAMPKLPLARLTDVVVETMSV